MINKLNIDIVKGYRERTLYITANFEHMLEFKIKMNAILTQSHEHNIMSYYYIDNQDNFWLTTEFLEQNLKLDLSKFIKCKKYLDIENDKQIEFCKIENINIFFAYFYDRFTFDESVRTEECLMIIYLTVLTIIFLNSRKGAPRKNIIIENKSYSIQVPEDGTMYQIPNILGLRG
jgi:hypothetical protein